MTYTKERKLFSDALSDTYEIIDEYNYHCNITEYYSEGVINQSYSDLSEGKNRNLYRCLWMLKDLSLPYISHIIQIEDNNGISVVWESFYGLTLKEYIKKYDKKISYRTFLNVISPLLDDFETAHQNGLYFTVSPETICLSDGGELMLNTMINPSADIHTVSKGIAQSIFYMLTGLSYGNLRKSVDEYIPSPLLILLNDVLTDAKEFEDIGEFHNELRAAVRAAEYIDLADITRDAVSGRLKMSSGKIAAISICIGFFSIIMLVLRFLIL